MQSVYSKFSTPAFGSCFVARRDGGLFLFQLYVFKDVCDMLTRKGLSRDVDHFEEHGITGEVFNQDADYLKELAP